jgi:hypothetical protein
MQKKRYVVKFPRKMVDSSKAEEKQRKKRAHRIENVMRSLPTVDSLVQLGDANKLPLIQLWGASLQFVHGFYENSILDSAFAAEYGLLLRLNEKLEQEEKNMIAEKKGGLSFSSAINRSKGVLIDEELAKSLVVLNNLRNMTAHPSNWITLFKQLEQKTFLNQEAIKHWISEITHESPEKTAERLKDDFDPDRAERALERLIAFKDERWGKLPDLLWAAHKETLRAQTDIVKEYSEKMIRDLILDKDIVKLTNQPKNAAKYIQRRYPYPEELAARAIQIAHETLKRLHFLE